MAGLSTLSDEFSSGSAPNPTLWPVTYGDSVTVAGGQALISCTTNFAGMVSAVTYTFDSISVQVTPPPKNGASADCYGAVMVFSDAQADGTTLGFYIDMIPATPVLYSVVWSGFFDAGAASVNYNATNHAWLHVTYNGSTIVWESSLTFAGARTTLRTMSSGLPGWITATDMGLYFDTHRDAGTGNNYAISAVNPLVAVTGTAVSNLGALTATATGLVTHTGTAAANLGALTATVTGTVIPAPKAVASLGTLTATATGLVTRSGTAVANLGALTATAVGTSDVVLTDLQITVHAGRDDDWYPDGDDTLAADFDTSSDQRSWRLMVAGDTGLPFLVWSPDGTLASALQAVATDRPPINAAGEVHLRVLLDTDDGAGGWTVTFETVYEEGGPWVQLGDVISNSGGGTTSLFDSPAPITIGAYLAGGSPVANFVGKVFSVEVRNGPDGAILVSPDFTGHPDGTTSFDDAQGNTWTVHSPASIVSPDTSVTLAMLGPLATDECATWTDWNVPRTGVGVTCDHSPDLCCASYRVRTVGLIDDSLVVSDWSDLAPEICFTWTEDEHLIRSTGPDGELWVPVLGKFSWDVDRPFTSAFGVNGTRFVTSSPPGGRNMHMTAAVESEADLAQMLTVLARPLTLISPSDASEVWAVPVAGSARIVKIGRIRQVTADFIATGPQPEPQLADVGA